MKSDDKPSSRLSVEESPILLGLPRERTFKIFLLMSLKNFFSVWDFINYNLNVCTLKASRFKFFFPPFCPDKTLLCLLQTSSYKQTWKAAKPHCSMSQHNGINKSLVLSSIRQPGKTGTQVPDQTSSPDTSIFSSLSVIGSFVGKVV